MSSYKNWGNHNERHSKIEIHLSDYDEKILHKFHFARPRRTNFIHYTNFHCDFNSALFSSYRFEKIVKMLINFLHFLLPFFLPFPHHKYCRFYFCVFGGDRQQQQSENSLFFFGVGKKVKMEKSIIFRSHKILFGALFFVKNWIKTDEFWLSSTESLKLMTL